ncbi:hypothetical protein NliqN6_4685 [Naganishia liquefaciens]|uniref:Uncharacterized protein n=1 Tax=Naganishia liquefaciens TaxID=104408 RepID=A0A8H3YGH0_9TREE|nr:hypothetical protein NliqN6_4685 [Naganishia liquefaciens]
MFRPLSFPDKRIALSMFKNVSSSLRSAGTVMSQTGEFFCQACGRHTSHAAEKRKQASLQYTPPKYCSKRCKSTGKPSMAIVLAWKLLLDKASLEGKPQAVMCSEVQHEVFGDAGSTASSERASESDDSIRLTNAEQSQRNGMKRAKEREDSRRTARLIYHFGFQHFQPKPVIEESVEDKAGPKKKAGRAVHTGSAPLERQLEAIQNGKVIRDVTHAKGEWGLRYKRD